jgi:hypothetical protein
MKVDWSQFWPSMIATFVGFALALLGQWIFETLKDRSDAKKLGKKLFSEIKLIKVALDSLPIGKTILKDPLKTPIRDSAVAGGIISKLNHDLRKKFLDMYDVIDEFNSWFSTDADHYIMHNSHNEQLLSRLQMLKEEIKAFDIN